jgi:hypothetical protein
VWIAREYLDDVELVVLKGAGQALKGSGVDLRQSQAAQYQEATQVTSKCPGFRVFRVFTVFGFLGFSGLPIFRVFSSRVCFILPSPICFVYTLLLS